jgi:site-specific DNA-adenine methylase
LLKKLKAPFPWFGGKSRVAHLVWPRFGDVSNYVEPFAGSLAVLWGRPTAPRMETVNDLDCYLANFWRALQAEPEAVAQYADWPVNEADLHARHQWLHAQAAFRARMDKDPHFFDVKIAGWWVWGLSAWIGDNWCRVMEQKSAPHMIGEKGVNFYCGGGTGLDRRRPHLSSGHGNGVHAKLEAKRPAIGGRGTRPNNGNGVHAESKSKANGLLKFMLDLAARLRRVRVCCGDWSRVVKPSVTICNGLTAVFLDPPYGVEDRDKVYNHDSRGLAAKVRAYCVENGANRMLRIALCGYEGEHNALEALGWEKIAWKATGGYGNQGVDGNANAKRERIWFSPHCLKPRDNLFDLANDNGQRTTDN